jgi:blocked-early-in-transport protein 1
MALLESQSEDTVNEMKYKIGALKDLSLAMGDQINKSKDTIVELGEDMGLSSEKIKNNMNRMRLFVERSGVGWKVWAGFTVILMWLFIWVWLF